MAEVSAARAHNDPVRLGVYRHYKHTDRIPRYYQVIGIARHTRTEEHLVIYVPLYPAGGPRMAARPLSNFVEPAVVDGERVKRFTYIGVEIPSSRFNQPNKEDELPSATEKRMLAEVVGSETILDVATMMVTGGNRNREISFKVAFPSDEAVILVRLFSIRRRYGSVMPFVLGGEILEINGNEWVSLRAYFEMTANHSLMGSCTINEFPPELLP